MNGETAGKPKDTGETKKAQEKLKVEEEENKEKGRKYNKLKEKKDKGREHGKGSDGRLAVLYRKRGASEAIT
ncbi:hypothetical protein MUK42_32574 [Musa troglodytarum]|uniref:Uncharacterized protein n=1 Tax=Musa troglodytarum TaxID=320322 RepID=A0A9E7HKX7_9LILI|nr:hypothetical protein MUK42_32574 [Musa troglodytarum]